MNEPTVILHIVVEFHYKKQANTLYTWKWNIHQSNQLRFDIVPFIPYKGSGLIELVL